MLFVTGDVHADIKDFTGRKFGRLKKDDAVVVCGDFGILWDGSDAEKKVMKALGKKKYKTLFIDGAHENFDLLNSYPISNWNGGRVHVLSGNLIHLMRGEIYDIAGKKVFVFGGGESLDREMREPGKSWWADEMPTTEEMQRGADNLANAGWQVDYIFTHEPPTAFKRFFDPDDKNLNALNIYLDIVREKCSYTKWIFGSSHRDRRYASNSEAVFTGVVRLN